MPLDLAISSAAAEESIRTTILTNMWFILLPLSLIILVKADSRDGWQSHVSDGVTSLGYKVLYADEDYTVVNEVITREDKKLALKHKERLKDRITPLPTEDVKCLMSVDRHCSKSMGEMKSVLIQAIKEDCAKCTNQQKEEAGKVIASLMAHDPVAWKMFLTRYDGLKKVERILG